MLLHESNDNDVIQLPPEACTKRASGLRLERGRFSVAEVMAKSEEIEMDAKMMMEVPAQLREVAGQSVDQAEKAFGAFIDAAGKSVAMMPAPAGDVPKQILSVAEKNIKASFEHARKLLGAKDLQEVMQIQTEFVRAQFAAATEQMKKFGSGTDGLQA